MPNIALFLSHDHSLEAFAPSAKILGNQKPTPFISSILDKGQVFSHAFCETSNLSASQASIFTGIHSHAFFSNLDQKNTSDSLFALATNLQNSGYRTAYFGNWVLKSKPIGFDHWEILTNSDHFFNPEVQSPKDKKIVEGHTTDIITDLCLNWLKSNENNEKPFFVFVSYNGTKRPWMPSLRNLEIYDDVLLKEPDTLFEEHKNKAPPSRYQEMSIIKNLDMVEDLFILHSGEENNATGENGNVFRLNIARMNEEQRSTWYFSWQPKNEAFSRENYENESLTRWKYQRFVKNYLRCVKSIDENLARFHNFTNRSKSSNAIVFYTSHSGRFLGSNGWFGRLWSYEASSRIPFFIYDTGFDLINPKINNQFISHVDIAPTILSIAGCQIPSMNGSDLLKIDQAKPLDKMSQRYFHHQEFPGEYMVPKHCSVRTKSHKIIHYYQFDEWELFDLSKDPAEKNNLLLKNESRDLELEMKELLQKTRKSIGDDAPVTIMPEEWRRIYRGPKARNE